MCLEEAKSWNSRSIPCTKVGRIESVRLQVLDKSVAVQGGRVSLSGDVDTFASMWTAWQVYTSLPPAVVVESSPRLQATTTTSLLGSVQPDFFATTLPTSGAVSMKPSTAMHGDYFSREARSYKSFLPVQDEARAHWLTENHGVAFIENYFCGDATTSPGLATEDAASTSAQPCFFIRNLEVDVQLSLGADSLKALAKQFSVQVWTNVARPGVSSWVSVQDIHVSIMDFEVVDGVAASPLEYTVRHPATDGKPSLFFRLQRVALPGKMHLQENRVWIDPGRHWLTLGPEVVRFVRSAFEAWVKAVSPLATATDRFCHSPAVFVQLLKVEEVQVTVDFYASGMESRTFTGDILEVFVLVPFRNLQVALPGVCHHAAMDLESALGVVFAKWSAFIHVHAHEWVASINSSWLPLRSISNVSVEISRLAGLHKTSSKRKWFMNTTEIYFLSG